MPMGTVAPIVETESVMISGDIIPLRTVNLLTADTLNVNNPLLAVNLNNLAFTALVGTTDDHDFVILANGDGARLMQRNQT